jgi:hypothetical protein
MAFGSPPSPISPVDQSQVSAMIVGRRFLDRAETLGEDGTKTGS